MNENKKPISLREGKMFLNGIEVFDCVKCNIKFTPDVWNGKVIGEKTDSSRWLGYKITGDITRRRSTPWLKDAINDYIKTGKTPEFTVQGILNDKGSDYYEEFGSDTVTLNGVVLSGEIQLLSMDASGDVLEDTVSFNAHSMN